MISFKDELEEMVSGKNLMNSYKLYFLKSLLLTISKDKRDFDFYEMACWMCAYSFADVCKLQRRIRPLDKLYDTAVMIIEECDLMESSSISEVFEATQLVENRKIRRTILSLCDYVPYRLLAYLWPKELMGRTDAEKNRLIEELSRSAGRNIYAIFTISASQKSIEIKPDWVEYIVGSRKELIVWIDKIIEEFVWKDV